MKDACSFYIKFCINKALTLSHLMYLQLKSTLLERKANEAMFIRDKFL